MKRKQLLELSIRACLEASKQIMDIYNREFTVEQKEDKSPLTEADTAAHNIIKATLKQSLLPILSEEGQTIDYQERAKWDTYWCVDPIDGTKEFIKRNGEFTVNIALIENQVPVLGVIYAPVIETLYFAEENIGSFKIELKKSKDIEVILNKAVKLPCSQSSVYTVVGSRSHMSEKTQAFLEELKREYGNLDIVSKGSSLKLCMVAEGVADIYPRYAPTMEWDTAAGQAIAEFSGAQVIDYETKKSLVYNKQELKNPWFTVKRN